MFKNTHLYMASRYEGRIDDDRVLFTAEDVY